MKIIITGGNGFLGTHLVKFFLEKKFQLLIVSNNNNNLISYLDKITFTNSLSYDIVDKFKPDVVLHLAWDGGNSYADVNNINQINKNIPNSISILEVINRLEKKPHFIGLGTFAEYGIFDSLVNEESDINPISFYGLSKNCFKNISEMYCKQNDISWTWARVCYVYGPKDVETRLIPSIILKLIRNENIKLNSCDTIIDYLYIDDFCNLIDSIIQKKVLGLYNICAGREYKIKDVIQFIKDNINSQSTLSFDPNLDRKYVSKFMCGSNKKIKEKTDWEIKTEIEEGLLKTINYYVQR